MKKIKKHRKLIICITCLLLAGVLQFVRVHMIRSLSDLQAAEHFADDGTYAQIACFFSEGVEVPVERTREFSYKLESGLITNAIETESENENARLFLTCYAAEGSLKLSRAGKSVDADAIGTGGDYFFFHPVTLASGMYYSSDALSNDQILIDETLAWQLFGGFDVEGQEVSIGGQPHVVRGVVKTGEGRMREAAGSAGALVYLPVETLLENGTVYGTDNSISSFEAVLPNPVRNFAADLAREQLPFDETQMLIVDHGVRFDIPALYRVLKSFGLRSMTGTLYRYPYWENLARGTEDILAFFLPLQAVLLLVPVLFFILWIIKKYRGKKWTAQELFLRIDEKIYESQASRRLAKHRA